MNDREKQEEAIFEQAVQIASNVERVAYLDKACGDDPELRARLEVLLEGHFKGRGFLEGESGRAAGPAGTVGVSPPGEEEVGKVIGRYKLLEKVGEGGFGAVYVAEQREPVKRRVALKIIKLGMDTRQVIARFEAERQALALMDHPNIAKVLDAGATETGRPYFVMELVRGMRITDYCDQNNLPTEKRLDLFMQVCHAIQHAHQKGIIHRDIKPSNILVTVVDGRPVPKVIDFGIAKATQGGLTDQTVYTQLHQFIGTPAYMSPEQTQLSGVDVDTRSDIYSLGVLLYELLTAHTPFDPKTLLAAGLDEMRLMIREQEPPRPSTRLSTLDDPERTKVAKHRQAEPGALSRLVRGDLDWIVMKCLEKERGRRYETANGLAQDIEHHLNQEPVMAAAPGALYRAGKFVRRHKAGLAAATALVLLLAAGAVVSTWQAVRATNARRAAVAEAAKATAIRDLLERALQSASPDAAKGSDYTVRQLLDDFSAGLGDQLKGQPEVEAEIWATIGNAYRRLEATEKAQSHLERALALRRRLFGDQHPKFAESLVDLAFNQFMRARYAEGEALTRQALAVFRQQDLKRERVRALAMLQLCLWLQGRFLEAEQVSREALSLAQGLPGDKLPETADILHRLSGIKRDLGDLVEAERLAREAVALHRQLHGNTHPETGYALRDLGWTLEAQGKYAEAAPCYGEVRTIMQKQYGSTHPVAVDAASLLAGALVSAGRVAEAEPLFREVGHAGNAKALNDLAWRLATRPESTFRDGTNAVELAQKAVAVTSRTNAMYLDSLAAAYAASGQYTNAVKAQQEAIALVQDEKQKREFGSRLSLYESGSAYCELGALAKQVGILLAAGKFADAEPLARRCLDIWEKQIPGDWRTFNAQSLLGAALLGQKKYAEAEPLLVAGYEGMKCREHRIPPAAKPRLQEAIERLVRLNEALAAESPGSTEYRQELAAAYRQLLNLTTNTSPLATQDCSRALALIDRSIARTRRGTSEAADEAAWYHSKGKLLEEVGRLEEGLAAMTKALELASANTNGHALTPKEARLSRSSLLQRMNRLTEAGADRCQALNIPRRPSQARTNLIDLSLFYNASLKPNWHSDTWENDLAALPTGIQTLASTEFDIRGLVQVSRLLPLYPALVTNIPVGQACQRLLFLHAACYADVVLDGTQLGRYVVHYLNGRQGEIPLVMGQDLDDWWEQANEKGKHFVVAWTGSNGKSQKYNRRIRLFKTTWSNPRPGLAIQSIDFEAMDKPGSPFLVAITVE